MILLRTLQEWAVEWKVLVFGQVIALSLACCSAASATLQDMTGIKNMPLFQIAGGYFFLGFFYIFAMDRRKLNFPLEVEVIHGNTKLASESTNLLVNGEIEEGNGISNTTHEKNNVTSHHFPCVTSLKLHSPWYFYALLAFLDVQANFFVVLSFRYTSLISTNLLTSLSVISVIISSRIILKRVFKLHHFIGGFLVLIGAFLIVSSDLKMGQSKNNDYYDIINNNNHASGAIHHNTTSKRHFVGDFFAITAALVFGLNDTLAEYCIHNSTVEEYLAMLGIFGCLFSIGESVIFERIQIRQLITLVIDAITESKEHNSIIHHEEELSNENVDFAMIGLVWVGYIVSLFVFYTMASYFLTISDATLLNLSLQFSNMWTMIFSIVIQHIFPTSIFYCAVVVIFIGVLMYEKGLVLIEGNASFIEL